MTSPDPSTRHVIWQPQPGPQTELLSCPVKDVLFGGATGGGKTDGLLGDYLAQAIDYPGAARGIFFRRSYPELDEVVQRSHEIYRPMDWKYRQKDRTWVSPVGDTLRMRFLDKDNDWRLYWGHSYSWMGRDELGNWPNPAPLDKLYARLRSAHGVPTRMRSSANPGGPGHGWVKRRYIDPAPPKTPFMASLGFDQKTGQEKFIERCFIPSRVQDNLILMANDPGYVDGLYAVGNAALVKAWLEGDWNAPVGQFFSEWDENVHIVSECALPPHWLRFRALDWGSITPFCCLWIAVSDGALPQFPFGALVVYREWYGCKSEKEPNEGLNLLPADVASGIRSREHPDETIAYGVADYQINRRDSGPSIAEQMQPHLYWRSADKERPAGLQQVRGRLQGHDYGKIGWRPMLYIMGTCPHLIRTLPMLQHDEDKPGDAFKASGTEDHAPDALRYGCMSRPWVVPKAPAPAFKPPTLDDMLAAHANRSQQQERMRGY